MNARSSKLVADDFKPLGSSYAHDEFFVETEDGKVVVVPRRYTKLQLLAGVAFMLLISTPLFGLMLWAVLRRFDFSILKSLAVLAIPWLLAVLGPIAFAYFRSEYWQRRAPLIAFDTEAETVSVHADSRIFQRNEVLCLVALAFPGDECTHGEIQLVTQPEDSDGSKYSLVVTSIGSIELYSGLGRLLDEFTSQTGIPGYFLRNGVLKEMRGAT